MSVILYTIQGHSPLPPPTSRTNSNLFRLDDTVQVPRLVHYVARTVGKTRTVGIRLKCLLFCFRWLELFPKILSAIAAQEIVVYAGKDMNGPDYKSHILNSLCSGR